MVVNGLANTKDSVMVPNLKPTKVPSMTSKNIEFFINVFSTSKFFDDRMAICTTWMQYPLICNGTIVIQFFIGMVLSVSPNIIVIGTYSFTYHYRVIFYMYHRGLSCFGMKKASTTFSYDTLCME